jgi:hypothetical protein
MSALVPIADIATGICAPTGNIDLISGPRGSNGLPDE